MSARRHWWVVGVAVTLLALLVGVLRLVVVPQFRPVLLPGKTYAVDVSHHQGVVDWPQVAASGVGFAYLKATEGRGYADAAFARNWSETAATGIRRGAYHFFTLCAAGAEQAANFLRVAPPDPTALSPAVDLEILGGCADRPPPADVEAELREFVGAVEAAWGRPLVFYARRSWTRRYPVTAWADRPRWRTSFFVRPRADWAVWQVQYWTRIRGISGPVDLDVVRLGW